MKTLAAKPLTADAFRAYGCVFEAPTDFKRTYFDEALASSRPAARPSLSVARVQPLASPTLVTSKMERHEFSSQSFIPLDVARYLVIVAPMSTIYRPDESRLEAFLARGTQGVTYGQNVWHHPLTVLDRPASFAITMWLDGSQTDEQFVELETPLTVTFPA